MSSMKRILIAATGFAAAVWIAACCCRNSPPPETACGADAGSGGAPSNSSSLTSTRACSPTNACPTGSATAPFDCTVWDQCFVTGGTGNGHCKVKLNPSLGGGANNSAKCVAGSRLQCTTASGAEGVYVCNPSNVAPACDWPSESCLKCGGSTGGTSSGSQEPCCISGCNSGFHCGSGTKCVSD